jgi:hypothetical protein
MTEWKPETAEMTKLLFDLSNFENLPEWFKEELSKMVISDLYGIAEKNMRE